MWQQWLWALGNMISWKCQFYKHSLKTIFLHHHLFVAGDMALHHSERSILFSIHLCAGCDDGFWFSEMSWAPGLDLVTDPILQTQHLVTTLTSHINTHAATCAMLSLSLSQQNLLTRGCSILLTVLTSPSPCVSLFSVSRPIFNCRPLVPGPVSARSSAPWRQLELPRVRYSLLQTLAQLSLSAAGPGPNTGNIQIIFSTDTRFSLAPGTTMASSNCRYLNTYISPQ